MQKCKFNERIFDWMQITSSFENKEWISSTRLLWELTNLLSLNCTSHQNDSVTQILVEAPFVRNGNELTDSIQCKEFSEYFDWLKAKFPGHGYLVTENSVDEQTTATAQHDRGKRTFLVARLFPWKKIPFKNRFWNYDINYAPTTYRLASTKILIEWPTTKRVSSLTIHTVELLCIKRQ